MNFILYKNGEISFTPNLTKRWGAADMGTLDAWVSRAGLLLPLNSNAVRLLSFINNYGKGNVPSSCITTWCAMLLTPEGDLINVEFQEIAGKVGLYRNYKLQGEGVTWAVAPFTDTDRVGGLALQLKPNLEEALELVCQMDPFIRDFYQIRQVEELTEWVRGAMVEKFGPEACEPYDWEQVTIKDTL